jgi:hypothetical protein
MKSGPVTHKHRGQNLNPRLPPRHAQSVAMHAIFLRPRGFLGGARLRPRQTREYRSERLRWLAVLAAERACIRGKRGTVDREMQPSRVACRAAERGLTGTQAGKRQGNRLGRDGRQRRGLRPRTGRRTLSPGRVPAAAEREAHHPPLRGHLLAPTLVPRPRCGRPARSAVTCRSR